MTVASGVGTQIRVPHIVKGELVLGDEVDHGRLLTPAIDLDSLIWSRREPGPAFDVPLDEIIDLLVEVGRRLDPDTNEWLAEALAHATATSHLTPRLMEGFYRALPELFGRASLEFQVENEIGRRFVDGWGEVTDAYGVVHRVRAFPPRLVHIVAGNTPGTAAVTIIRGALTKGVNLMKLGSDDPLTASAILRTMAEVAPGHPILRSFSAVYWKGGDQRIENPLFRAQYFDKIVAWGGEAAIRNAISYVTPGFELVAFDPKVSISILGHDALADAETIAESAAAAATDVALYNQGACASSRFIYAEGSVDELAPWCDALALELGVDRPLSDGHGVPIPAAVSDELDGLRYLGRRLPPLRQRRHRCGDPLGGAGRLPPGGQGRQRGGAAGHPRRRRPRHGGHPDHRGVPARPRRASCATCSARPGCNASSRLGRGGQQGSRAAPRRLLPARPTREVARR